MKIGDREYMPEEDRMRALLVGKKIISAEIRDERPYEYGIGPTGLLALDDGTVLKVWGNDGGCSCGAGDYALTELNACDNIITNVEIDAEPSGEDTPCRTCGQERWRCYEEDHDNRGRYRVFVFADNRKVNLATFEGDDGNGYYGTGWWLSVSGS